ncbi:MAG: hypothetical protein ACK5MF_13670 [Vibrio sp.]|uniref:hypothetical protein n=1 Tax=Vibrio sp. TaxID=678 RepID=UPI003A845318
MKKTLIELNNLDEHICVDSNSLYLDGTIILTPLAKDELSRRGVTIKRGSLPTSDKSQPATSCSTDCVCDRCIEQVATGDNEKLFYSIAAVLKQDFGVTDSNQLQAISCRMVKKINQ